MSKYSPERRISFPFETLNCTADKVPLKDSLLSPCYPPSYPHFAPPPETGEVDDLFRITQLISSRARTGKLSEIATLDSNQNDFSILNC